MALSIPHCLVYRRLYPKVQNIMQADIVNWLSHYPYSVLIFSIANIFILRKSDIRSLAPLPQSRRLPARFPPGFRFIVFMPAERIIQIIYNI